MPARIGQTDLKLALRTTSFIGVTLFRLATAERAGVSHFEPIRIYGGGAGGGQGLRGQAARGVPVEIAGMQFSTSLLMVPNESSNLAHAFQGAPFDGYIGADLLNRMIVEVNYDEERIRVIPPDQYVPPEGWSTLPLRMLKGSPRLKVNLNFEDRSVEALLRLYTMSNEAVIIDVESDPQALSPPASQDLFIETGSIKQDIGKAARIPSLQLGPWTLPGPILSFPGEKVFLGLHVQGVHGYLGPEILRRFNYALDFPKQRIVLQPNRSFGDEMDFDRSGLTFEYERPEMSLKVAHVLEGSPAQKAGLATGDLILELDGKPVSAMSRFAAYRMLRGRPGELVRLRYRRGSSVKEAAFEKRALF